MKNYQKGFANIILVIAVVVIVGVIGYFIFSNKSVAPTETQQTQTSNNNGQGGKQINIPSDGTVIVSNNLSIHKSASCGFEVSFPSQFINWERPANPYPKQCPGTVPLDRQVNALSLKSKANCNISSTGESSAGCNFFEIAVVNNKITGPAVEKITVDNIPAEKLIIMTEEGDGQGVGQILIQVEKNKLWYRYTHTFSFSDVKEAKKLSDLIISTFKFTR